MKALTFIHSFYSKIRFSAVILFIMITISVLSLVLTTGVIRYYAYQYNLIKDVDIENGVYIMRSVENEWGRNSEEELNNVSKFIEEMEQYKGVESVIIPKTVHTFQSGKYYISVQLINDDMLELFPIRTQGKLNVEEFKNTSIENMAVIVGSQIFNWRDSGAKDMITLRKSNLTTVDLKITPIEQLRYPYLHIYFGVGGTYITANDLFGDTQVLMVYETPELLEYFAENATIGASNNIFVVLEEGINEENSPELFDFIKKTGDYAKYSDILSNTKEEMDSMLKLYVPIPAYLMFISFITLFSVSVLVVNKKMKDMAIYHICGLGKKRILLHFLTSMGLIYVPSILLNIGFVIAYPYVREKGIIDMSEFILDEYTILYVIIYGLILLGITIAVPLVMTRGETAINTLRRVE